MKYELPEDIKKHSFFCWTENNAVKYSKCLKCKMTTNSFECWKNHLIQDLKMDCEVENEQHSEKYASCPSCKSKDIVGCAFDSYLCAKCGTGFKLSKEQQKECLGNNYIEINETELNEALENAKIQ